MSTIICALCDATSTTEETGGLITGICHACYTSAEPAYAISTVCCALCDTPYTVGGLIGGLCRSCYDAEFAAGPFAWPGCFCTRCGIKFEPTNPLEDEVAHTLHACPACTTPDELRQATGAEYAEHYVSLPPLTNLGKDPDYVEDPNDDPFGDDIPF